MSADPQQQVNQAPQDDNPIGFASPGPTVQPGTDVDPPLHVSNWNTFTANFDSAFSSTGVMAAYRANKNFLNQADTSTPILNTDQVHELRKTRPGIAFPDMVRASTAQGITDRYDEQAQRQLLLKNAQPGLLGGIAGLSGSLLGSVATNPIGIPVGAGLGNALGLGRAALADSFIQRTAARIAIGSAEGAGFQATNEFADNSEKISEGDSLDPIRNLKNIGNAMFLGGALHPIHGFISDAFPKAKELLRDRPFFNSEGSDDVATTATNQMTQGKDPNIMTPLKNATVPEINRLHEEMADAGVNQDDMLNALDSAKSGIDDAVTDNQSQTDALNQSIVDRDPTDDEQKQLDDLKQAKQDLDLATDAHAVYSHMVNNPDLSVTKNEMDEFIREQDDPRTDFAAGRGQAFVEPTGAPIKDHITNLEDQFPDDYKKELIDSSKLLDDQKDELDDIKKSSGRRDALRKAVNATIMCLGG